MIIPLVQLACFALLSCAFPAAAEPPALRIIAAENVYGDVARQVGGNHVAVTSILSNPDQDPHLFEISASIGRAVAHAQIVISNGIDYDPWMGRMLASGPAPGRTVIVVADLVGRRTGDNPHIWYDPGTMLALAKRLSEACTAIDPSHSNDYAAGLQRFTASVKPVQDRITALRQRLQGTQVTATEMVFGYMIAALGMVSRNQRFQLALMNETEARPSDVAAFEDDLRSHRVKLLVFNRQATDAVADRMKAIAVAAGVPVLGAAETEPAGMTYRAWMMTELDALGKALPGK